LVGVFVGVFVGVLVGVLVGVSVGVFVGVFVGLFVGLFVAVGVAVAASIVWRFPLIGPPDKIAPCPVVAPTATIDELLIELSKNSFASPATFRLNTSRNVWGAPGPKVTKPAKFTNVTDPLAVKLWPPSNRVSEPLYSPLEPGELSW
jgi:hypothetical protein